MSNDDLYLDVVTTGKFIQKIFFPKKKKSSKDYFKTKSAQNHPRMYPLGQQHKQLCSGIPTDPIFSPDPYILLGFSELFYIKREKKIEKSKPRQFSIK